MTHRLQLLLDEERYERVAEVAREQRISVAAVIRDAIDREYVIFFEHDPVTIAGIIRERDGKRSVEQVL